MKSRRNDAYRIRVEAAKIAKSRFHPNHISNDDERRFRGQDNAPSYLASFTKGLSHNHHTALVEKPADFELFVKAIDSGDPRDFRDTPLGPNRYTNGQTGTPNWKSYKAQHLGARNKKDIPKKEQDRNPANIRAWESQGAGNVFDLEGPDAQAVTMPPAPSLGGDELTAEITEIYAQALLRDVPFSCIKDNVKSSELQHSDSNLDADEIQEIIANLKECDWFQNTNHCNLSEAEKLRLRGIPNNQTLFRGITPGDDKGPYISQYLLIGNSGINGNDTSSGITEQSGYISYGAVRIDQRVRVARPLEDYMTQWDDWFDVQNGADLRGQEAYVESAYRFITTPRDLATYVHYDALYEAYLNACLILLAQGVPYDPGIPFQAPDIRDHQQGFAHFGGPHILSLVTEVATRALKAVRFQKFNIHRRMRPEVLAARFSKHEILETCQGPLTQMTQANGLSKILTKIRDRNAADANINGCNYLLPMAFCEGSPMHPSYGAGHATVAGACVTILKAFFDHTQVLDSVFEAEKDGSCIKPVKNAPTLTVEGELNKLASNISIGRNWAGVHYFSDYIESIRMGEEIAIGILQEQKITYGENFSMTVPLFDGGSMRI